MRKPGENSLEKETEIDRGFPSVPDELAIRYSGFKCLGAGAMGAVFRAHDSNLDKDVAIKLLKRGHALAPEMAVRFQKEAKAASKLKHINLVTLMDFGILGNGQPYIIMECVEGKSLASILGSNKTVSIPAMFNIIGQVCRGMEHAHSTGVVHRDLKPSNVIVCDDDLNSCLVKVLDFGVAMLETDTAGGITRTGTILGTPYYMSPEQSGRKTVDRRADVYATGSMMFRMLSGEHPFEGESILEILHDKQNNPAPLINEVNPSLSIPEEIEAIIARCLEIDPDERYQTMPELYDALATAMEKLHIEIVETGVKDVIEPRPFQLPSRKTLKICGVVFAALSLFLCGIYFMAERSQEPLKPPEGPPAPKLSQAQQEERLKNLFDLRFPGIWKAAGILHDEDLEYLAKHPQPNMNELWLGFQECTTSQDLIGEKGWAAVQRMKIVKLDCTNAKLSDDMMHYIADNKYIQKLILARTEVSDAGIKYLENKPLRLLNLNQTLVTDKCIDSINTMKQLKELELGETKFTHEGLKKLTNMNLTSLNLAVTKVNDESMKLVAQRTGLKEIWLGRTDVTSTGIRALRPLHLVYFNADAAKHFDDNSLKLVVEQWPDIEVINVGSTDVTGDGIKYLSALKKCRRLLIGNLKQVDDTSIMPILSLRKLFSINMNCTDITDETLKRIAKMKVKEVSVLGCKKVTYSGCEVLEKKGIRVEKSPWTPEQSGFIDLLGR